MRQKVIDWDGPVTEVLTLALATVPSTALAWGATGHEVVCEIAYLELTPRTRIEVQALMDLDPQYRTFVSSCNWADRDENGRRVRPSEHYANVPRDDLTFEVPCPKATACIVSAVLNDMRDLALFDQPAERLRLLKSLGHWVGDLHQPVHVSFADDLGGNNIAVQGACSGNFHELWDTCILQERLGSGASEIAIDLRAAVTEEDRAAWLPKDITPEVVMNWVQESLDITTAPSTLYCRREADTCQPNNEQAALNITPAYLDDQAPIVARRLAQAGVRLGGILNQIFDEEGASAAPASPSGLLKIRPDQPVAMSVLDGNAAAVATSPARLVLRVESADGNLLGEWKIEIPGDFIDQLLEGDVIENVSISAEDADMGSLTALLLIFK